MPEDDQIERIIYTVAGPTIQRFHTSPAFVRGIKGVLGSGKSTACVMELLRRAQEQKPYRGERRSRWAIIRNTSPDLKRTTLNDFLEWIPELDIPGYCHRVIRQPPMHSSLTMRAQDGTIIKAEFLFVALDREDDVRKLKSLSVTGAWINEASEIDKAILDMAIGRIDRYPPKRQGGATWFGIIMDTNPPDTESWWYKAAEEERPEGWEFFAQPPAILRIPKQNEDDQQLYVPNQGQDPRYPPAENIENLGSGYQYYMRQVGGKSEEWIKVFLMGEYGVIAYGKPVYEGYYNDGKHFAGKELEVYGGLPLLIGVDAGLTPAIAIGQITPRGQLRLIDEIATQDMMGMKQLIINGIKPLLVNNYSGMHHIMLCDPTGINMRSQADSDSATAFRILRESGFNAELAVTNNPQARRDSVITYLTRMVDGHPGLLISSKCKKIREGFLGKYQYRKKHLQSGITYGGDPEKNFWSHVAECVQYIACHGETGGASGGQMPNRSNARREIVKHSSLGWT